MKTILGCLFAGLMAPAVAAPVSFPFQFKTEGGIEYATTFEVDFEEQSCAPLLEVPDDRLLFTFTDREALARIPVPDGIVLTDLEFRNFIQYPTGYEVDAYLHSGLRIFDGGRVWLTSLTKCVKCGFTATTHFNGAPYCIDDHPGGPLKGNPPTPGTGNPPRQKIKRAHTSGG